MILHLTRGDSFTRVPLCLPAAQSEIDNAYEQLDEIGSPPPTKMLAAISPIDNLIKYISSADLDNHNDLVKLNQLAGLIDKMTEQDLITYAGALEAECVESVRGAITTAEQLDDFALIPNVCNDHDLGRYLVKTGYFDVSENLLPHINYASVGKEYRSNWGGAFILEGYVRRKNIQPALDQDRAAVFIAHLYRSGGHGATDLKLPASGAWLEHAKQALGISEFCQAKMRTLECKIPCLSELLPTECVSVEDANALAMAVEEMMKIDGDLLKFCSALTVEKPDTFHSALQIAQNIDIYDRVPSDPTEYAMDQLAAAGAGDEILGLIRKYTDLDAMGKALMDEDGVVLTEFGAVRNLAEPFNSQSTGGMQMA